VGILTISDRCSRGEAEDLSSVEIEKMLTGGFKVVRKAIVPDEAQEIKRCLLSWSDSEGLDFIITTGGTGLSTRDVTPEATREVLDREIPGIPEVMRQEGFRTTPRAVLSRAVAGVRRKTLIINLPGSPKACREGLRLILSTIPHAVDLLHDRVEGCGQR
jgi:molybdenum cofactor synthesis domain-containing protein